MAWGTLEQWTIPMCQEEKHLGDSSARLGFLFRGYSLAINQGAIPYLISLASRAASLMTFPVISVKSAEPDMVRSRSVDEFGCE